MKKILCLLALLIVGWFSMPLLSTHIDSSSALSTWYNNSWMYRQPITVSNANASSLSDFQVQITLDNTNFDFTKALENGADVRFVDSTHSTIQPHWFEKYDPVGQQAIVWVKVSSLAASADTTVYMYYGNPLAEQASNGVSTFSFFDDFTDHDVSDWTLRSISAVPFFNDGQVVIRERTNDYAYIKRAFSGSFTGKTVEALMEYGHPNSSEYPQGSNSGMGESNHPRLTVTPAPLTGVGVGPVDYGGGTLPADRRRYWINTSQTSSAAAVFSFTWGDRIVDRISFIDASTVQFALRSASSSTWLEQANVAYTVSTLDNAFIALGKNPNENVNIGGAFGIHQWDWVRVREYAATEPTSTVGAVTSQDLFVSLSLDTSMPGSLATKYTFTITPNQPIPNGGEIRIDFPSDYDAAFDNIAFTTGSLSIDAHGQITGGTFAIDRTNNIISYELTSATDVTDNIVIHVGDGAAGLTDVRHPTASGPFGITVTSFDALNNDLAVGNVTVSTSPWWNTSWQYRKSLHINNQRVSGSLTNYAVQLDLNASNFDFTHAKANGEDLRFISPDGTELDYWIESFDSGSELARVWVEMPSISANTEQMVLMYFGNVAASTTSNGVTTFPFIDDFSDNDISDWTLVSGTPGAITVNSGVVSVNEKRDNLGYLAKNYTSSLSSSILEAAARYIDANIGESYHPHIGYFVDQTHNLGAGPVRYDAGTVPTDNMRTWKNGVRTDFTGTNFTTGQDMVMAIHTGQNYAIALSKLLTASTWGSSNALEFDPSTLVNPDIILGKRPFDSSHSTNLDTGSLAEHQWKWVRIRNYVAFEPSTSLGGEESNLLPLTPTNVFLNTVTNTAATNSLTPLLLETTALVLSAEFQDANGADQASHYSYDIATDSGFTNIVDAKSYQVLTSNVNVGARSEDIALTASNLNFNTTYYARLQFFDVAGHISPYSSTYTFKATDTTAPTEQSLSPASGATDVAVNTNITFELADDRTDFIASSLDVTLGGNPVITSGVCQAGYSCTITPTTKNLQVSIDPDADFSTASSIALHYDVEDAAGNELTRDTSFTTVSGAPVVIGNTSNRTPNDGGVLVRTGGGGGSSSNGLTRVPRSEQFTTSPQLDRAQNEHDSGYVVLQDRRAELVPYSTKVQDNVLLEGGAMFPLRSASESVLLKTLSQLHYQVVNGLPSNAPSLRPKTQLSVPTLCESLPATYNYELPNDISDEMFDRIQLLHSVGLNLSQDRFRVVSFAEQPTRAEVLQYLLQVRCADIASDVAQIELFLDVPKDHPLRLFIALGRKLHIVNGYLHDGLFKPDQIATQAETLKMIVEFFTDDLDLQEGNEGQWYKKYSDYASEKGVLKASLSYDADEPVTVEFLIHLMIEALVLLNLS